MDSLPSAKELKKLADACRKAGITSFKGAGIEFTLSDSLPPSNYKKRQAKAQPSPLNPTSTDPANIDQIPSVDQLDPMELLFWSSVGFDPTKEDSPQ